MILGVILKSGVEELKKLLTDDDMWIKPEGGIRDVLDEDKYQQAFPRSEKRNHISWTTESSRAIAFIPMNHLDLVDMITDYAWSFLFPNMVATERTLKVYTSGSSSDTNSPHMTSKLVSKKLHAASPMMATRIFAVLRTCYQIDQGTWIVAEISPDSPNGRYFHRLPSGCLIERITEDQSKVTWVEHTEVVTTLPNQTSAFAFGAQRMAAWLERYCEKTSLMEATYTLETQGIDVPMNQEKFMLMEFGDTMVRGLFRNISPIEYNTGSSLLSSVEDLRVHASVYKSFYNAQVVGAMVAFPVKHSPEFVLRTLADSRKHHQWDVLGGFKKLSKPRRHSTGGDPKNNISVSVIEGGSSSSSNEMLLIKEVDVNLSGSLVVWSTVSKTYFDHLISSGDVISKDSMLVSGFSITTDNHNTFGGSVITLVLRMPVEEEEEGKRQSLQEKEKQAMMESITLAIIKTVERVKEALDKQRLPPPPRRERQSRRCKKPKLSK